MTNDIDVQVLALMDDDGLMSLKRPRVVTGTLNVLGLGIANVCRAPALVHRGTKAKLVILKNALNFYDGVNGQSGIYYLVVFLFLFFKSDYNFFYLTIIVSLTFVLLLNLNNKLFFGDNGVYLVSTLIIISLIYEYNITKNILYVDEIFLILILPGIDLVRLTIERLVSGKNPFFGDRNHLHHLLIKKFNLMITNVFLFTFNVLPIVLFYLDIKFINICILFLTIYFVVIISLQKSQSSNI